MNLEIEYPILEPKEKKTIPELRNLIHNKIGL